MSANQSSTKNSLSVADPLERTLAKIKAAERKKFLNENIVRLEKNGDLSYEAVRTYRVPIAECREGEAPVEPVGRAVPAAQAKEPAAEECQHFVNDPPAQPSEIHANPNLLPNKLPQTPVPQENGNLIADSAEGVARAPSLCDGRCNAKHGAQPESPPSLTSNDSIAPVGHEPSPNPGINCHEDPPTGNQQPVGRAVPAEQATDPLEELLHRALIATKSRRGRPAALDDHAKGQLIALLSVGMSMRQAAAVLGVAHTTVQKTLKADPALAEEITAARFQAQLQPLACVIREARCSWKAATWLLKYLDAKIASHEETPDERRQRQQRESDEFFARAGGRNVKTRHVLG